MKNVSPTQEIQKTYQQNIILGNINLVILPPEHNTEMLATSGRHIVGRGNKGSRTTNKFFFLQPARKPALTTSAYFPIMQVMFPLLDRCPSWSGILCCLYKSSAVLSLLVAAVFLLTNTIGYGSVKRHPNEFAQSKIHLLCQCIEATQLPLVN